MHYNPNFNDPRIQRRLAQVLGWCRYNLSPNKAHSWHQSAIDGAFGSHSNKFSKWLRRKLLITVSNHYSFRNSAGKVMSFGKKDASFEPTDDTGTCKTYIRNQKHYKELLSHLKDDFIPPAWKTIHSQTLPNTNSISGLQVTKEDKLGLSFIATRFGDEISNGFKYNTPPCGRLTHPLQQVQKIFKPNLWRNIGFYWDCDIATCAPTLLLQFARFRGFQSLTPAYDFYLADRTTYRQQLANDLNIPITLAKVILTSLFNGAHISTSPRRALMNSIKRETKSFQPEIINKLKKLPYITSLKDDISSMWSFLRVSEFPNQPKITITRKHTQTQTALVGYKSYSRTKALNGSQRWSIYHRLERQVLNAVIPTLEAQGRVFLEHDGWRTDFDPNTKELERIIFSKTGFKVTIDKVKL